MSIGDSFFTRDQRSRPADLSFDRLEQYYEGSQPLGFLHPDLTKSLGDRLRPLVINLPRLVVDSIEERLDVEGFLGGDGDQADEEMWRLWQANDLDEQSPLVHYESLIYGRGFVMVWANPDDPATPRITVESCRELTVVYDPATRQIVSATKCWESNGLRYRTRYDQQWIFKEQRPIGAPSSVGWEARDEPIPNVLGVVPIVPFVNRPTLIRPQGESEMTDVIPIADAINKLATDMMVGAEFQAMPRRWAAGIDLGDNDEQAEEQRQKTWEKWSLAPQGRVWETDNENARFGQFPSADLNNFTNAIGMLTARAAAMSGLPPHYFGQAGENPASADALRASESALVKRAQRKQRILGGSWERVMRLALLVRDGEIPETYRRMETIWRSAETPTVAQKADAAVKLVTAEIIDDEQAQEDLGYSPEQRARMKERKDAGLIAREKAMLTEAKRLMTEEGLTQDAAYAAVGMVASARIQNQQNPPPQAPPAPPA